MRKHSPSACAFLAALAPLLVAAGVVHAQPTGKVVIAHRGASGYLPEHTLAAKAVAHASGADLVEQDLVMTRDGRVVVLHDVHLDRVTDVQDLFPDRHRDDGRYYAIDFTLAEIRRLRVSERYTVTGGKKVAVYPSRFPLDASRFRVHTFEEEIELIQGMNRSTGRTVGLYPEIKQPAFHLKEGQDISRAVIEVLKKYGYTGKRSDLFLQLFDFDEMKRIHDRLLPSMKVEMNVVFLVNAGSEYRWITEAGGMETVARYADGIGPSLSLVVSKDSTPENLKITSLVKDAHDAGLVVHPYTFRVEEDSIPGYAKDHEDLLRIHLYEAEVDGVFTDFPDRAVQFLEQGPVPAL